MAKTYSISLGKPRFKGNQKHEIIHDNQVIGWVYGLNGRYAGVKPIVRLEGHYDLELLKEIIDVVETIISP